MSDKNMNVDVIKFLFKASVKLGMNSVPVATAAAIYHKFFQATDIEKFDPYLIAATALYLAGKVEEEHVKLRDVVNVAYRCLHDDKPPLELDATYWALRDSVVQCELLIVRVLCFNVTFDHPHKYLLQYLKSVCDWLETEVKDTVPVARTSWSLLRDSYVTPQCMRYLPSHVAIAVLYMALHLHGVDVPHNDLADRQWWQVLSPDISVEKIEEIMGHLCSVYDCDSDAQ